MSANRFRAPLFSQTVGNPGELDQMLSFASEDLTLFAFEDLTRTLLAGGGIPLQPGSDDEFTDLVITIDTALNRRSPSRPRSWSCWRAVWWCWDVRGGIEVAGWRRSCSYSQRPFQLPRSQRRFLIPLTCTTSPT